MKKIVQCSKAPIKYVCMVGQFPNWNAPKHNSPFSCPSVRVRNCGVSVVNIRQFAKMKISPTNLQRNLQVIQTIQRRCNKNCEHFYFQLRPPNIVEYENLVRLLFFRIRVMGTQSSFSTQHNFLPFFFFFKSIVSKNSMSCIKEFY